MGAVMSSPSLPSLSSLSALQPSPGRPPSRRVPAEPRFDAIVGTFGVDSCPPLSARRRLDWKARLGLAHDRSQTLAEARLDFAETLHDVRTDAAFALQARIARTRSLPELWHLREPCFSLVAHAHGQPEAMRRLATLNRHFA